ncbi:RNA polymerase sigma factor [Draconibacterium halophilum]|uniref:Sigma-70 family RNA polymerase sigma factor n=1 Tax=Draconibacterium halophilum TaxID=2706887 RepID=A0A6C0RH46_9BACT|nr:sigma-70 family RNA polymerase sigma factor [Draconibacterium halophilum]QIA09152.1 sigma-70 family RNA polymerase sigma factor [Draconibacterium halophilum]
MNNKTDKIIWREFINEREDALSFIYHQNVDFLFFYGKKFTTDESLIVDVIQDLFFYLISKRENLGETDNIRIYLLKSFRRRLFENLKKKKKELEQIKEYSIEPRIVFSVEEKIIFDEEESEKELELKRGMEKLNAKQREVLYYRFTCGFDYQQICEIMSISYDTARQMVSRSIQSLKKYLISRGFIFVILFGRKKK